MTYELSFTPLRPAVPDQDYPAAFDVLLRLRGPSTAPVGRQRPTLNLALVLDRSGSMDGRPLAEALRCAAFVVDSLDHRDFVSLVVYDNDVNVLVPTTRLADRDRLHRALRQVHAGGTTALFDGWYQGAQMAALARNEAVVSRVLLLSDGQANRGLTDLPSIISHCTSTAVGGISTSTYGLGHHFNEELMTEMARAGGGNAYYGETAGDLMDPFREEFELLGALSARRVRLSLQAVPGVRFEVINGYSQTGEGTWQMPDLAYGGEVWALVRLVADRAWPSEDLAGQPALLKAAVTFDMPDGAGHAEAVLSLPVVPLASFNALPDDETVQARATELRFASLQEQAYAAARAGEWAQVDRVLEQAGRVARDHAWLAESHRALEAYARKRQHERFSKEAMYTSLKLRSRMMSMDESTHAYRYEVESARPAYLRRKREQGKEQS